VRHRKRDSVLRAGAAARLRFVSRVWVVGSLNVDRGWRVSRHPQVGETVFGEVQAPAPGGKGLNQAVAARRFGAEVALVGSVGDDDDGPWLTGLVAAEGIDASRVAALVGHRTGSALIVVDEAGANTVTVDPGANASLEVPVLPVTAGDVVVAQLEVPVEAVRTAFALAADVGATSVLNPSPLGRDRSLLSLADVVVVNQPEAAELAGSCGEASTAEAALGQAAKIGRRRQTVVVTLGSDGAVASGPAGEVVAPGSAVDVVDTTGAGDCFLGVLVAGLADGQTMDRAIVRANRAAAVAVTRWGTVAAMPTADEIDQTGVR